jgi:hypothetical protein
MTPRTLNQLVAFTLNRQPYALRLASVRKVLRMVEATPLPKAPEIVLGVVSLHGTVVPVLTKKPPQGNGLSEGQLSLSLSLALAHEAGYGHEPDGVYSGVGTERWTSRRSQEGKGSAEQL